MAKSIYLRVKEAKKSIHGMNRLGWPDTEDGICRLTEHLDEFQQAVIYSGRFIKRWDGWHFNFPSTDHVIQVMEGLLPLGEEIRFFEDMEG